jgi:hypothetical protein
MGARNHESALRMIWLRQSMSCQANTKEIGHSLLLDGMRLAHLCAQAPIEAEANQPSLLSIMHLPVPRPSFGRILRRDRRLPMQIQIRRHADGHAEEEPGLVLLVPLHRAAAPEGQQQICLDDLDGFVARGGDVEGELLGEILQTRLQLGSCGVEFCRDRADLCEYLAEGGGKRETAYSSLTRTVIGSILTKACESLGLTDCIASKRQKKRQQPRKTRNSAHLTLR